MAGQGARNGQDLPLATGRFAPETSRSRDTLGGTATDPNQPFEFSLNPKVLLMVPSHIIVILFLSAVVAACAGDPIDAELEVPEVVEIFACGDYCPGPEEKYLKRVYDGVTDEEECRKLGGKPYTWIDWGQKWVCEVR